MPSVQVSSFRRLPGLLCCLIIAGLSISVKAHGPLDHSSRLFVGESEMELVLTLGSDATQRILAAAGFPEAEIRRIQSLTSAQSAQPLPGEIAAKLFDVTANGQPLPGHSVRVRGEGMESLFFLTFSRPSIGILEFRAKFLDGLALLKPGAFVALDQNQQSLGAAQLSRGNNYIQIKLPAKTGVEAKPEVVAVAKAASPEARAGNESQTVVAPVATAGFVPSAPSRFWLLGLVIGLATLLVWFALRRWRQRGGKEVAPS